MVSVDLSQPLWTLLRTPFCCPLRYTLADACEVPRPPREKGGGGPELRLKALWERWDCRTPVIVPARWRVWGECTVASLVMRGLRFLGLNAPLAVIRQWFDLLPRSFFKADLHQSDLYHQMADA